MLILENYFLELELRLSRFTPNEFDNASLLSKQDLELFRAISCARGELVYAENIKFIIFYFNNLKYLQIKFKFIELRDNVAIFAIFAEFKLSYKLIKDS